MEGGWVGIRFPVGHKVYKCDVVANVVGFPQLPLQHCRLKHPTEWVELGQKVWQHWVRSRSSVYKALVHMGRVTNSGVQPNMAVDLNPAFQMLRLTKPRHSMYAIYAHIDPQNHSNVGIYGIHGASGKVKIFKP